MTASRQALYWNRDKYGDLVGSREEGSSPLSRIHRAEVMAWVGAIQLDGLEQTRRLPGYHVEPLHGEWKGYRSIRLNRSYRGIYSIQDDGFLELVLVQTVSKHDY